MLVQVAPMTCKCLFASCQLPRGSPDNFIQLHTLYLQHLIRAKADLNTTRLFSKVFFVKKLWDCSPKNESSVFIYSPSFHSHWLSSTEHKIIYIYFLSIQWKSMGSEKKSVCIYILFFYIFVYVYVCIYIILYIHIHQGRFLRGGKGGIVSMRQCGWENNRYYKNKTVQIWLYIILKA